MIRIEGTVDALHISPGSAGGPARYALGFRDGAQLPLNELLQHGLTLTVDGPVSCRHCGREGRRSFGDGYCYDCFSTLARCDLCVVSPDRCHYHLGTCREPDWGEAFCMQPHTVYLANSSGIKVGITRRGRELGRWLDQGAIQGLDIMSADSRRAAGMAEVRIAERLSDRTDWRRMLRGDVPELDLMDALGIVRRSEIALPEGVGWQIGARVTRLHYPLPAHVAATRLHRVEAGESVSGNLLGIKGQYLVLDTGALNVRQLISYRVTFQAGDPLADAPGAHQQLGLF